MWRFATMMAPNDRSEASARAGPVPGASTHEDELIPLRRVPDELPRLRRGKKVHVATLYGWTNGRRGIKLRYLQIGATRCTTRRWLGEFFAALTAAGTGAPQDPAPAACRRAAEQADRELDRLGL
jgi:hypothetical protein